MTGLRQSVRGSSLQEASSGDFHSSLGSSRPPCLVRRDALHGAGSVYLAAMVVVS